MPEQEKTSAAIEQVEIEELILGINEVPVNKKKFLPEKIAQDIVGPALQTESVRNEIKAIRKKAGKISNEELIEICKKIEINNG